MGTDRWSYILQNFIRFGGLAPLFLCVCFGVYYIFFIEQRTTQKKLGMLLCALGIAYSLYPILSGKFWEYHWMPFYYFASLWTGILLNPEFIWLNKTTAKGIHRIQEGWTQLIFLVIFLAASFTAIGPSENFILQIQAQKPAPIVRADLVADFLKLRMKPGDTVQPLDSVLGDIIQGMLVSDAVIATPFIYDYQFYHDVSNPYIQNLRVEFIQKLNQSSPRFIVEYLNRPIPMGLNASSVFPELEQFINQSYKIIYQKNKIRIYIRK